MIIKVAHDYICPWCWIALAQTARLSVRFGIAFDWVGYELMPENLPWPDPTPAVPLPGNRPPTPTRLELAYAAEGMSPPTATRPKQMRIHNALEATEFMKEIGHGQAFIEKMYRALWEDGLEINQPDVICKIASSWTDQMVELRNAMESKRFDDRIVKFDDEAYAEGVFNVPTYFIGDKRLAEQPSLVLAKEMSEFLNQVEA